jgi:hypothetical protein
VKKCSLAILCSVSVLIQCAAADNREWSDVWSEGGAAVGSYSGVVLSASNQHISGVAFVANAFVVFDCGDTTCAAPTSRKLAIDHQRISNYALIRSDTDEPESLLIFGERGRDGLRKVLCRDVSCATRSEEHLRGFRYGAWRIAHGGVPQLVAKVESSTKELSGLVRFECSTWRCDDGAAQIIARSVDAGYLGVAAGDNELWVVNAARNSAALDVYRCDDADCTKVLVPSLEAGVATSVEAAYVDGTAWFVVTQRSDIEKRGTVSLFACRRAACRAVRDVFDERPVEHVRVAAGSRGPVIAYTDMRDGHLRLAQCSEVGCRTFVVVPQGTPYAVALKTDIVVVAYSTAGYPRLALCKDDECVTHEIVRPSLFRDAAPAH